MVPLDAKCRQTKSWVQQPRENSQNITTLSLHHNPTVRPLEGVADELPVHEEVPVVGRLGSLGGHGDVVLVDGSTAARHSGRCRLHCGVQTEAGPLDEHERSCGGKGRQGPMLAVLVLVGKGGINGSGTRKERRG